MATPVLMPKQGITVETCMITKWFKAVGDSVAAGDVLYTYETDKSAFDVEAETAGTLLEIFYGPDDEIPVLTNVAAIGTPGEDVSALRPGGKAAAPADAAASASSSPSEAAGAAAEPEIPPEAIERPFLRISPRARALAEKTGVNPAFVSGTGPMGRVVEADIRAAAQTITPAAARAGLQPGAGTGIGGRVSLGDLPAQYPDTNAPVLPTTHSGAENTAASGAAAVSPSAPAVPASQEPPEFTDEKLPVIRRTIARQMNASLQTMAQLTLHSSFDATEIQRFRKACKANESMGLAAVTLTDIVCYAVVRTLLQSEHRALNAHLLDDAMRYFRPVHLGLAVDTPRGLMVPTIPNADRLSLRQLSAAAKDAAAACQAGNIAPDRLQGGTFTVSNLGTFGVEAFTPVINPPQTAILGLTTIQQKPREIDGQIRLYPAMGLSLTFDHRALDGAPAARFLRDLSKNLENFGLLLAL